MADVRIVSAMVFGVLCKKKEGRDEGKGKFGNGTGYKEDGEKVH